MILPALIVALVFTINGVSSASVGAAEDIENSRYLYVTGLDGNKHVIDRMTRPIPKEVHPVDVNFYLFTRQDNTGSVTINMADFTGNLDATSFDSTLPTFFFIHGWTIDHTYHLEVPKLLLNQDTGIGANVFLVDYRRVAKFFYTYAVGSLPEVSEIVADAIKDIVDRYGMDYSQINLMGHSLGGQMSGFVGARLGGQCNQIIALDPAGPLFENKDPSVRLDPTDAKLVQVIHTNGGLLGYRGSLGDVDFFPNSGRMNQPGCDADLLGICAHIRALLLYYESMHSNNFVGTKCDTYENYLAGSCDSNHKSLLGSIYADREASGNYYLRTAVDAPFALG